MNFAASRFLQSGDDDTQSAMQSVRDLMEYADPTLLATLEAKVGSRELWTFLHFCQSALKITISFSFHPTPAIAASRPFVLFVSLVSG